MKNKSIKHKDANTFKFVPFSERISNINIDVFYKVQHEYESLCDEQESFFYQTIQKWDVLNLSDGYNAFKKEARVYSNITLVQVVYNKDYIIEVLLKHLSYKNVLCLQPLLELVVALAQDLRKDFYEYYQKLLEVLVDLLNTKDAEQLEWTFTCLAYLFKILWRPFVKHINTVLITLLPLLSEYKPEYINNFAAESFAFVARKVKDKKNFLKLILKAVKHREDKIIGCGLLLFKVIHGIDGNLHSCAEVLLPFYFKSLSDTDIPQEQLFKILEQVVGNLIENVSPEKGKMFWHVCIETLDEFLKVWNHDKSIRSSYNIDFMLKFMGQGVGYRGGRFLTLKEQFFERLRTTLSIKDFPENILMTATKIIIIVLLAKNIRLHQDEANILIRTIIDLPSKGVLFYFVENTLESTYFEALILPSFLKQCIECNLNDLCTQVLVKLIIKKSPLCQSGMDLSSWKRYAINFKSIENNLQIENILTQRISIENIEEMLEATFEQYLCAVICLPHVKLHNQKEVASKLKENIKLLCDCINEGINLNKILFILHVTIDAAVHIFDPEMLLSLNDILMDKILKLTTNVQCWDSLKILDLYITAMKCVNEFFNDNRLQNLHVTLEKNFSSPYHEIRLLTTHIYSLFEDNLVLTFDNLTEDWNVFSICHKVESIQPQVHTFREQLRYLEKFNQGKSQVRMASGTVYKMVPLRYLCGVLYMNFKLLWDPVIDIISTHANNTDINNFWNVFVGELYLTKDNVRNKMQISIDTIEFQHSFLLTIYEQTNNLCVKPDFQNYRLLLWQAMKSFPEVCEAKTRNVSELFLDFIAEEYTRSSTESSLTLNIKKKETAIDESINIYEQVDTDEAVKKKLLTPVAKTGGVNLVKFLIQQLSVFSKMRSPRSLYREQELYKLYIDLLSHKNSDVQKVALDCIMTYKFKYLTPYSSHLYNLIDDKNFKIELTLFDVSKDGSMVQKEDREQLIPIVMKIVFSKMTVKTGMRTGGKVGGQKRRNMIFRFLAGCRENEMKSFIRMALHLYQNYLNMDILTMISSITSSINLEKFLQPKRLQSSINLINVVLEHFGCLMNNDLLEMLLKLTVVIGTFVKAVFNHQQNIYEGYLPIFKNLRVGGIKTVTRFFKLFEAYPWTSQEIDAVFKVFVWPYLGKLHIEGIHSPTALLKLLTLWGNVPRYFPLLVKYEENNQEQYPLVCVIKLLLHQKSHSSVINLIMEMIENLLSLESDPNDVEISLHNLLPVQSDIKSGIPAVRNLNYGSCILLPLVDLVLEWFRMKLETTSKNITERDLLILSRISELVWKPDVSNKLLKLLLPITLKKCHRNMSEDTALQLITTLNNLMKNVEDPQQHLRKIFPLFAAVKYPSSRKMLCELLELTSNKCGFQTDIIRDLNAWDLKWIDQPDFQKRSDAFRNVQNLIEENAIDLNLGVMLIYNCYYFLGEKDLALRENASYTLKKLSPVLITSNLKPSDVRYILDEILFPIIRNGFRNKNDDIRNECISLLGHLARECPESHVILRDLNKLTSKLDPEVDFFENLIHLQLHRHGRALLKFSNVYKEELLLPNIRTLTQYALPLISYYLCTEKYVSKHSLVDSAVEALGTIARLLPWHHYEALLTFHLNQLKSKLMYQKQLVKVIVIVLDAFHFDLSKGQGEVFNETEVQVQGNDNSVIDSIKAQSKGNENSDKDDKSILNDENKIPNIESDGGAEYMDLNLDEIAVEYEDLEPEDNEKIGENVTKPYDKITILCKSASCRVTRTIHKILLPQLHKVLAEMAQHEKYHKLNKKRTRVEREEEDLTRIPISLAVVKLLQRLPKDILRANLPGVFIKTCTFLKSELESVRKVTRETLQKIMTTLGPEYLGLLLEEMITLLPQGYQTHVLVYTMHAILSCLRNKYKPSHIDSILSVAVKLCRIDLFGYLAEEKEVAKIGSRISEAKSTKSVDTFQILAQFITDKCMMDLVLPIKEVVMTSHSYKVVIKAQECLRRIALGLIDNEYISVKSLLVFSYGVASNSIPQLLTGGENPICNETNQEKILRKTPDTFIIPPEPIYRTGRRLNQVKSSAKTNAHLMVEFGLKICHLLMKREKLQGNYNEFLDPYVIIFKQCLKAKQVKLSTITLNCLERAIKYDLPAMKDNIKEITESIFDFLHKYAAAGLSKGDNFDLVVAAFKTMAVLVKDIKYHTIDAEQLKVLLLYVEQDMHDHDRQATAFVLLKAIISRKLIIPEIHDVMAKISELSITSELEHVRLQSRLVFHQFVLDYPLGNKLENHIAFYLSQLGYEMKSGRESALEMIQTFISSFPMSTLREYSGIFLITMGARLVNDEDPECRKKISKCLSAMFVRLSKPDCDPLFDVILKWLTDNKISHRQMAAQLCGLLVLAEKSSFQTRLIVLVPIILSQFSLTDNIKLGNKKSLEEFECSEDHYIFQVFQLILKLCAHCPDFLKQTESIEKLAVHAQKLLAHPHQWVRLVAAQFLGFVLSSLDMARLEELVVTGVNEEIGYLFSNTLETLRSLALDLCAQLEPEYINAEMANQVVKNLVFIARVLQRVPSSNGGKNVNLLWLTKRMLRIINSEVTAATSSTVLRMEVFKWIAGIATIIDVENVFPILNYLLAPLTREILVTHKSNVSLKHMARQVTNVLKQRVGLEKYTRSLAAVQHKMDVKRAERKRSHAQMAITDPELYARKKIKKNEKKKESKKRKLSAVTGKQRKRVKKTVIELDNDEFL